MKNENFSCKNCGGPMKYDPKSQNLKCENCGYQVELPKEMTYKRHALKEYEYNLRKVPEEKTTVIQCESCGATIELSSEKASTNCPYCGSNIIVSEKIMSILEPDGLRPFLIEQKEVKTIFSNWIRKRWFAPNALKNLYQTGKIMGIYLPYWSFDNDADCDYVAEGGIDRMEEYEEDGKTYTRTITDWYPVRGNVENEFVDVVVPGSRSLQRKLLNKLPEFSVESTIKFDSGYLAGYSSEVFKVPMQEGYEQAKEIMRDVLENLISGDVLRNYDHVRSIRMSVKWYNEYYRLLMLPVYSTSYLYDKKTYQVVINGENGAIIGEYPKSVVKIMLAILAGIIVAILIYSFLKN
ncbi:hypothetical protein [Leptotrichia sp. oral taxon 847]|uniref:hypothetical protein n=1 Tax=Leptotrichia sp. oral taxon 847 TaxID=1785996 RepID=UPI000768239B|nr:hypothetical protein [Leptotrichia sp. oral taxon 847]AMD95278.1 hypothetical protein AXF11_06645 [Leptotrichia sp. oral taxon 847]